MGLEPGKYVLFASRLVREKGSQYLIPAFRKLKTDYKLVIAGDVQGEDKYKSELLKLADADSRILFPGYVEGRALGELFSNAAVYTQPSIVEGLSIALLEAMSYGLCCLVSDIPENLEATGECGVTFESENIDDLSETLDWVVNSPSQRESIGRQARLRVEGQYSWDTTARQFESYYQRILRERD